ncbi:MAG: hypothetical protein ABMA01_01565 [Chthoniobacteraceae bacterium]
MRPLFTATALLPVLASILSAAGPEQAFQPWSSVTPPPLHILAGGKIVTTTNASMNLDRGISAQAIYLVNVPVEVAEQTLLAFDSSKHPELGTIQHHRFHDEKDAAFETLRLDANIAACAVLLRSARDPKQFQMARDEVARIPGDQTAESIRQFLVSILRQRWTRFFQQGDLGSVRTYDARGEIQTLLREEPRITGHFAALLAPLTAKTGIGTPRLSYWDLSEVDKTGTIALGALYAGGTAGRRQFLDLTYYASSGYNSSMALYELVPVTVNGKPATLVWHGCLVSSTELAGGFGIKRKIAAGFIASDLEKAIRAFRSDAERAGR